MPDVLVTGATGRLGRVVMQVFTSRGIRAEGLSRKASGTDRQGDRQGDLLRTDTLPRVLRGIDVVVHCASHSRQPDEDVAAIDNLLRAANGVSHLVYIGIAGIEDAAKTFPYYRAKLECEARLAGGGVPYTVVRATQIHEFVDFILGRLRSGPFQFLPPMKLQPVDVEFVAAKVVEHALAPPRGRAPDIHGPQVLRARQLAEGRGLRIPVPGVGLLGVMNRLHTVVGDTGGRTWQEWNRYQSKR